MGLWGCAHSSPVSLVGSSVCHQGQRGCVSQGGWQTRGCCHSSNKPEAALVQASPDQPHDPTLAGQYKPCGFWVVIAEFVFIGLPQRHHWNTGGQTPGSQQSCALTAATMGSVMLRKCHGDSGCVGGASPTVCCVTPCSCSLDISSKEVLWVCVFLFFFLYFFYCC